MTIKSANSPGSNNGADVQGLFVMDDVLSAVRSSLLVVVLMVALAIFLESVLDPLIASSPVEQTVMTALSRILIFVFPFLAYMACGMAVSHLTKTSWLRAIITALIASFVVFVVITIGQYVLREGPFAPKGSLQFTLGSTDEGAVVEAIVPGGAADVAGLQAPCGYLSRHRARHQRAMPVP